MTERKMFFIYNPLAGKAQVKNKLMDIIDIFVKAGYEVTVYPTQNSGDAVEMVRQKSTTFDVIVCCGGDGTLDEVVTGLMQCEKKIPIGYIPAGSTNDFAHSLKIPSNMKQAALNIVKNNKFSCDIGEFNDDTFVYIAAFGVFTEVSYETRQNAKNVLGHMAYILEGAKRITSIKSYEMTIEYRSRVIEGEFIFGMITNSVSVGGFKSITGKNVQLDDGMFEVTLIKTPQNLMEAQAILGALLVREVDKRYMYTFKTDKLKISAHKEIQWTLDGEYGGAHKEVFIRNNMKAIEIFV